MADIRINALATTATTPASDDYLALDGTAQGTRKILATNIANNVTDVILGSSGPSVKSTLSARAPRQGLVFDGTAGATFGGVIFGSSDFTVSAWISVNSLSANNVIIDTSVGGAPNAFALYVATDGSIRRLHRSTSTTVSTAAGVISVGKTYLVTYVRGALYVNGVLQNTFSDTSNYSTSMDRIGWAASSDSFCTGFLSVLIYNRALSASEVVSLYEAGAPAGADYPATAAGVALNTSAWTADPAVTFTSTSGDNISITATSSAGYAYTAPVFAIKTGQTIRLSGSFTSIAGNPRIQLLEGGNVKSGLASITATGAEVVATGSSSSAKLVIYCSGSGVTVTGTGIVVTATGLLLAPDAAQAGGGLVWYDTSGNAANITLPASGVSWNVPSSQKTASGWTYGGNLTVSSSSAYLKLASTGSSNTWDLFSDSNGSFYLSQSGVVNALRVFPTTGNLSIGAASTDGGQKLQVSGTAAVVSSGTDQRTFLATNSAGSAEFGVFPNGKGYIGTTTNDNFEFYSNNTLALTLDSSQNATFAKKVAFTAQASGTTLVDLSSTDDAKILGYGGNTFLRMGGNFTLEASGEGFLNIAGSTVTRMASTYFKLFQPLWLNNAYVAGAPTATGYVTIKDSNGTTYKVLVGT